MPSVNESSPLLSPGLAQDPAGANHRLGDICILGTAFFFIFSAFTTISSISSTVLPPGISFMASGMLYIAFAISNLFIASAVVDVIGSRAGLFLAALTYAVYNIANIYAVQATGNEELQISILVPAAIVNGFGASVLWASQGVYLVRCSSPATLGRYSGLFYAFMWTSGIFGPLFMSVLFQREIDKVMVFEIVTGISLLGLVLLAYLWVYRPEPSNPYAVQLPSLASSSSSDSTPVFLKTARLILTPSMLLLIPVSYMTACEQSFYNGLLPLFINSGNTSADLPIKLYLRACIGVVTVASSFFVGSLTDRLGSRVMVVFCLVLHVVSQSLLLLMNPLNNIGVLVTVYICIGLSNSTLINQSQKLVGVSFPSSLTSQAYAAYKFHTSLGAAISFFCSKYTLGDDLLPMMAVWAPLFWTLIVATCIATFAIETQRR
ncbi:major facilitator superfamily domain-containing protein [Obelidium mucronatum]|nr:major facilitator superfamily domain-containing protein [Obelidium mucronatum]